MPWPDGDGIGGGGGNALLRYAKIVLEDGPVGYWPGFWRSPVGTPPPEPPAGLPVSWQRWWLRGGLVEVVGGRNGRFVGRPPARGSGIDGLGSVHFASQPGQYVELADDPRWSLMPGNHGLTVEVWLRPDRLEFTDAAGAHTDYIHWLGKGVGGAHEWTFRLYSLTNTARRPNRLSFYAFNLGGGEGAGAHAQHGDNTRVEMRAGEWQHLVGTLEPFRGWPDPEHPGCGQEGASLYQNGTLIDGVAAGDSNDSYWGFPDNASSTLAQPVSFPLANSILALESAAGFRTHGVLIAAVQDDSGHFHARPLHRRQGQQPDRMHGGGCRRRLVRSPGQTGSLGDPSGARTGAAPLRYPRPRPVPAGIALPYRHLPEGAPAQPGPSPLPGRTRNQQDSRSECRSHWDRLNPTVFLSRCGSAMPSQAAPGRPRPTRLR